MAATGVALKISSARTAKLETALKTGREYYRLGIRTLHGDPDDTHDDWCSESQSSGYVENASQIDLSPLTDPSITISSSPESKQFKVTSSADGDNGCNHQISDATERLRIARQQEHEDAVDGWNCCSGTPRGSEDEMIFRNAIHDEAPERTTITRIVHSPLIVKPKEILPCDRIPLSLATLQRRKRAMPFPHQFDDPIIAKAARTTE